MIPNQKNQLFNPILEENKDFLEKEFEKAKQLLNEIEAWISMQNNPEKFDISKK